MEAKDINIYLNNENTKNQILELASSYEKYIILMNDTLQAENRNIRNENNDLKLRVKELEDENEEFDNSKRYTRGLLKNLVELEKLRKNVSDLKNVKNNKIFSNITNYIQNMKQEFLILFSVYLSIFIMMMLSNVYSTLELATLFTFVFSSHAYIIYMIKNIPLIQNTITDDCKIKELEDLIKKISDSQDFLNDYIDCI